MTGIVIVTWNSEEVIGACLDACAAIPGADIVVVDNASDDDTIGAVQRRAGVRLLANTRNRGFAAAVNQGIEALDTPVVLLLNPDAVPVSGVPLLNETALEKGVGAVAGQLLDHDGRRQDGFNVRRFPTAAVLALEVLGINRAFPWNPANRRYRMIPVEKDVQDVEQPAGAFLAVNREAWEAVGGFDEAFHPVWFEDVDFCLRLRQHGYRILYHSGAVARHTGGHSATRMEWGWRQLCWYESLLRYVAKHFAPAGRRLVAAAVMLACAPRAAIAGVVKNEKSAVSVYGKVFRLAWCCWRKASYFQTVTAGSSSRKGETGPAFLR